MTAFRTLRFMYELYEQFVMYVMTYPHRSVIYCQPRTALIHLFTYFRCPRLSFPVPLVTQRDVSFLN